MSALTALRSRRFLATWWPWRSLAFLVTSIPLIVVTAAALGLFAAPWIVLIRRLGTGRTDALEALLLFVAGAVLLGGLGPLVAWPLAGLERRRLRLADDRFLRLSPSRWRRFGYAVLLVTIVPVVYGVLAFIEILIVVLALSPWLVDQGPISFGIIIIATASEAVPYAVAGVIALASMPYLVAVTAGAHAAAARALLHTGSGEKLRAELVEVSRSRARMADAFEAERRRIERDLHDGAQQKLVGLTLQLGLAKIDLPEGSPAAAPVATAHRQAKELMGELRELIHGIRPQVLTDLGLPAALRDLAGQTPMPVDVHTELPSRPPEHLEATAYFVVAEALANVAKHSGAARAAVEARAEDGTLVVEVRDDGRGGADLERGTGLVGLADRVAVADGRMLLASPLGGPTMIRVELPWPRK
ncbi:sensor histidine kinase [Paractinoplanes ovalisporus]|uniref:sensor histidine kinase n=1 Tax=Paractinoplanes ovalisporus TaxID=2810368 RepID=UPI0027DD2F25|nr:histidine kinase [Actinoplanes ovalisporus]